jgi:spore maturation protein SpmA
MLNFVWSGFFVCAGIAALYQSVNGNADIWAELVNSLFLSAESGFKIALNLTGLLCFWLGLMKIAEAAHLTDKLALLLKPFFRKVMPDLPDNSPAFGSICLNMAANILGLDNAATPMGLKAMTQMQQHNPKKDTASPSQILFMVLNASSVTLIPVSILMYRQQAGSECPAAIFIPVLLATSASTLVGFSATALWLKLPIFNRIVGGYIGALMLFIGLITVGFWYMPPDLRSHISYIIGNFLLFCLILMFILSGLRHKVDVYETFIEGAKDGFKIAVQIIPYLVAMLTAIAVFRAAGCLEYISSGLAVVLESLNLDTEFLPALPTALMKPLSGSGARAMMLDTFRAYGVDSFQSFVASIVQGSTETSFYVLAVYFGAVKISKTGAALPLALLSDAAGIICAILLAYLFY